jgi:serine/threonine protein kinase
VAAINARTDINVRSTCESSRDSAIVRQIVGLVDAMSADESESASALRDIAECLQLFSQARLWKSDSTPANGRESTPGMNGAPCELPEMPSVDDRFTIQRLLGHGGFGVVLLAFDKRLQRDVALKLPRPEFLASRDIRERFLREAQAAASLDHPNIVPVYDTGEIGPMWFITSRYVAGPTLAQWLRQEVSPISPKQAAELVAVLAEAVGHAHSRGVLHRDLKPANVLLEPNTEQFDRHLPFTPRLSDFGLARRLDEASQVTRQNSLIGTPRYMAPEQASGRHRDVGIHTDVHGLGVILHELLTGCTPHSGDNDVEIMRRIIDEPATATALQSRRVPRDLQTICLKTLHRDPSQRYETAGALSADLRRFLGGEPIHARQVGRIERFARWCRRRPIQAALCAALCLVSIIGAVGITWQWIRAEHSLVLAQKESSRAEENLQNLELSFVDLALIFEEAELWSASDVGFPPIMAEKLQRYTETLLPQYSGNTQASLPIMAAVQAMNAKSLSDNHQYEAAEKEYRKSIDLWVDVVRQHPESSEHTRAFGITLLGYGNHLLKSGALSPDSGQSNFVSATFERLQLPPESELRAITEYAHMVGSLGYERLRRRKIPEALAAFELARQAWHELSRRSPQTVFRAREATVLAAIATREFRASHSMKDVFAHTREARRLIEQIVAAEPANTEYQLLLSNVLRDEAYYISRSPNRNTDPAVPLYRRSLDIEKRLLHDHPDDSAGLIQFGNVNLEFAQLLSDRHESSSALPYLQQAAETWSALLPTGALSKDTESRLAMVYCRIGEEQARTGHAAEAIAAFRRSIELAKTQCKTLNPPRKSITALIESNIQLGDVLTREGQREEAMKCFRAAIDLLKKQSAIRPDNLNFRKQLESTQARLSGLERAAPID